MDVVCAGVPCHANAEQGSNAPSDAAQAAKWKTFHKATEGYHGFGDSGCNQQSQKIMLHPSCMPTI
jgi:hypothetical protein